MDEAIPNDAMTTSRLPRRKTSPGDCPACPLEVRGLYADAHNALNAFDAMRAGHCDASRFHRKVEEMRGSIEKMKPIVEAHFSDPTHSKIFRDR